MGDYELVTQLATSDMGAVYKARHRQTGDIVAIKILAECVTSNPLRVQRFENAYNLGKHLNHPNVVRAMAFDAAGDSAYLVLEFVDGESLATRLDLTGAISECEAIALIAQVALGLNELHKHGMIHRDVKPDNILASRGGAAKLTGLGLAIALDASVQERIRRGLGAPGFLSPEQLMNRNADARSDIYSLGATLYRMVTGEQPFRLPGPLAAYLKKTGNDLIPPQQLEPALSKRSNDAICRALSADPALRPTSCLEFVDDLQ